jgi:hypothetical protein
MKEQRGPRLPLSLVQFTNDPEFARGIGFAA